MGIPVVAAEVSCQGSNGDGYYTGCDAYVTVDGPDCDDSQFDPSTECVRDDDRRENCGDGCLDDPRRGPPKWVPADPPRRYGA